MTSPLRAARAAFVFLTRIPVGGFPYTPDEWRWASAFFPLVGAVVGGLAASVFELLRPVGALGAAYFALGTSLLATGAFHEDGLADTSDALGGGYDREKVFAILKDSRIGSFGGAALVVSIAGRGALLAQAGARAIPALVLIGAVARTAPIWQMVALPYATPDGAKSRHVASAGPSQALVASTWPLLIGGALVASRHLETWRVGAAFLATGAVAILSGWRFKKRVGGITGDFLGATEQLAELAGFAVMAWAVG
jgi:adenosylcobinamide-GDP ribazoletransferase